MKQKTAGLTRIKMMTQAALMMLTQTLTQQMKQQTQLLQGQEARLHNSSSGSASRTSSLYAHWGDHQQQQQFKDGLVVLLVLLLVGEAGLVGVRSSSSSLKLRSFSCCMAWGSLVPGLSGLCG
jgi:hypothetical protein